MQIRFKQQIGVKGAYTGGSCISADQMRAADRFERRADTGGSCIIAYRMWKTNLNEPIRVDFDVQIILGEQIPDHCGGHGMAHNSLVCIGCNAEIFSEGRRRL